MSTTKSTQGVPEVDYKGIFERGSALYLILAPDVPKMTILGASDVYLQSTNRTREDIVGKGVFEAFPPNPDDVEGKMEKSFRAAFKRVIETRKPDIMPVQQYDIPRAEGGFETRYWSVVHNPILGPDGKVAQMAQRVEDVTELLVLKQRGEELTKRSQHMETEVLLRAREVQEANTKLAEANKELESFSYSVSHDLRTPLRSMVSFGELLMTEHQAALDGDAQGYLRRIVDAGKRMGLLIDGLLGLARLARQEVRREHVDLSTLARSVQDQLVSADPKRRVEFVIAPEMKAIGDSRLLELVLQNLINNAWKFTIKTDSPRIEIGRTAKQEFYVKDNGAGFDMKYADKLFGSFQRLHSEREFAGTGIGLATVHKIIQRHEGRIWAHGAQGEGATFFFTLPLTSSPSHM